MLGRGNHYRLQPLAIEAFGLGACGRYWDESGRAEFGRFFDQPIEPCPLDRREQQPDVWLGFGKAKLCDRDDAAAAASQLLDAAEPFAITRVECRDKRTGGQPQDVLQAMCLRRREPDRCSNRETL